MKFQKIIIAGLTGFLLFINLACRTDANNEIANAEETATPTPVKKLDDFEERLEAVQTANFDYIYAFRRTDGGEFDSDDKKFLKANAPSSTNQWVLTEDKKAVIAGSNYKFKPENLDNLKKRFNVEDYSTKIDDNSNVNVDNKNVSSNSNKNINKTK